jgi:hypothetical protein
MSNSTAIKKGDAAMRVGDRVFGAQTEAWGTIGAIVSMPHTDMLYAVTTGIVTGEEADSEILAEGRRSSVGRALPLDPSGDVEGTFHASNMLGLLKIDVPVLHGGSARAQTGDQSGKIVDDPLSTLGLTVLRQNGQAHRGTVTGLEVPVQVRVPGSDVIQNFDGLVEVTSMPGSTFADEAAGGQAVYMENGDILGLIVGGIEDRCIVAPLVGLVRQYNLALSDENAILRHNKYVNSTHPTVISGNRTEERPLVYSGQFDAFNMFVKVISETPMFYKSYEQRA